MNKLEITLKFAAPLLHNNTINIQLDATLRRAAATVQMVRRARPLPQRNEQGFRSKAPPINFALKDNDTYTIYSKPPREILSKSWRGGRLLMEQ
jgi:hypothetical protein